MAVAAELDPSPATLAVLAMAEEVEAGRAPLADLLKLIARRRADNRQSRARFWSERADDGRANLVLAAFEGFDSALGRLAWTAEKRPAHMGQAASGVRKTGVALQQAMAGFERTILGEGPRAFAAVNVLHNLGCAWLEARVDEAVWRAACAEFRVYHRSVIDEIDASAGRHETAVEARRLACSNILDALAGLERFVPEMGRAALDEALDPFERAHMQLRDALVDYEQQVFSGPTRSQTANRVIHIARGALEGRFPPDVAGGLAAQMSQEVQQAALAVQRAGRSPNLSPLQSLEMPRLGQVLDSMREALERIVASCDVANAADALQLAVDEAQAIIDSLQRSGQTPCLGCGISNLPDARCCVACGRNMPRLAGLFDVDVSTDAEMTEAMHEMVERCDRFALGGEPLEPFLTFLAEAEVRISEARERTAALELPSAPSTSTVDEENAAHEIIMRAAGTLGSLREGMDECLHGLAQVREAAVSGRPVAAGVEIYLNGCRRLQRAEPLENSLGMTIGGQGMFDAVG